MTSTAGGTLIFVFLILLFVGHAAAYELEIRNVHSGLCLEVPNHSQSNGQVIQQAPCDRSTWKQKFVLKPIGNKGFFVIIPGSNKCFNQRGPTMANGGVVQQWGCHPNDNMIVEIINNGRSMRFRHSGKCIMVPNLSTSPGTVVVQRTCDGSQSQNFQFKYRKLQRVKQVLTKRTLSHPPPLPTLAVINQAVLRIVDGYNYLQENRSDAKNRYIFHAQAKSFTYVIESKRRFRRLENRALLAIADDIDQPEFPISTENDEEDVIEIVESIHREEYATDPNNSSLYVLMSNTTTHLLNDTSSRMLSEMHGRRLGSSYTMEVRPDIVVFGGCGRPCSSGHRLLNAVSNRRRSLRGLASNDPDLPPISHVQSEQNIRVDKMIEKAFDKVSGLEDQ